MNHKAIIRGEKAHSYAQIDQREAHNLRTKYTPNADLNRAGLNQEYVNLTAQPLRDLVRARIQEAQGDLMPRAKQVLCMEFILTASPEFFTRDDRGQVGDVRESAWVKDNVEFARQRWGANLVGCQLHQDEKTPHFQLFVVPINEKDRLSANTVFNPQSLRELQTDYAAAMAPHGLERGQLQSRASHQSMQQMYARPQQTATEVASLVVPVKLPVAVIERPTLTDVARAGKYQQQQQEYVTAQMQASWNKLNDQLAKVGQLAVALSGEADQARELRRLLAAEQEANAKLREANAELQKANGQAKGESLVKEYEIDYLKDQLKTQQQASETAAAAAKRQGSEQYDKLAQQAVQGTLPPEVIARGQELHDQSLGQARKDMQRIKLRHFGNEAELISLLKEHSLQVAVAPGKLERVVRYSGVAAFRWAELAPGCQSAAEVVQQELTERREAERRGADVMKQLVAGKEFTSQSTFIARAKARGYDLVPPAASQAGWQLRERAGQWLMPLPLVDGQPLWVAVGKVIAEAERQRQQAAVTHVLERVLEVYFTDTARYLELVKVTSVKVTDTPEKGLLFHHKDGEVFTAAELRPNGRDLLNQVQTVSAGHRAANAQDYEQELKQRQQQSGRGI